MRGEGESDEGRGSGRGGVHFREERGRTGAVAHRRPSGGRLWLGDGRREEGSGLARPAGPVGQGEGGDVG
jgi:hypothetical protein